jgi:hypothetical protein
MRTRARAQLRVVTLPFSSGLVRMAALGMRSRAGVQPTVGTCLCSSGLVRMAALGMRTRAVVQPKLGTWPNVCPWDAYTCLYPAVRGHLAMLQWARADGCPWPDRHVCLDVARNAAANGHPAVADWARANGCPQHE